MRKQNAHAEIHQALDFGFSDYFEDENVRELTIDSHAAALLDVVAMLSAEEDMNFSLLNALGHDHPSPQMYALDFPSDLRGSLYLLLGGYYKQAIATLRNWVEMRLFGIYFGLVEPDRKKYDEWKQGQWEAPVGRSLIGRLFGRSEFHKADARVGVRGRIETLYGKLCAFTHGGGVEKYRLQDDTDNVPRYNRSSVELYCSMFHEAFAEVVYCLWLAYGTDACNISQESRRTILSKLREPYLLELRPSLTEE